MLDNPGVNPLRFVQVQGTVWSRLKRRMRHMSHRCARFIPKFLSVSLTLAMIMLILASCGGSKVETTPAFTPASTLSLSSTAFQDAESIPTKYTCSGQNVSPPINPNTVHLDVLFVVSYRKNGGYPKWRGQLQRFPRGHESRTISA